MTTPTFRGADAWIFLSLAFVCVGDCFSQVRPEPGIYRGTISVTKTIPALKINEVTSFVVVAEIQPFVAPLPGWPETAFVLIYPTNLPAPSKTLKVQGTFYLSTDYLLQQNYAPEIKFQGDAETIAIFRGGPIIPGTLKIAAKTLAWKTTSRQDLVSRRQDILTSVTLTKVSAAPPPDQVGAGAGGS